MLEPLTLEPSRYEHDTFMSIDANAQELAELLTARFDDAEHVLMICHSRGGLVARSASDLVDGTLASRLSIHTFGTPHRGTPLADLHALSRSFIFWSASSIQAM